ncbi:lanC-like protein GCL2 [Impatiens glandulifera]|uniref:lanC-like protein GCL2 n=1 Tax=Impatiens glandulifera TaxID=253017 RepID=UPI001FB0C5AF|nr:lanC-like protein GCL2 [Impatiens glandulifera]
MATRFFVNSLPDYEPEVPAVNPPGPGPGNTILELLSLPYSDFAIRLKEAALAIKETVVNETWGVGGERYNRNGNLYLGTLGTAFLLYKCYQVTGNTNDLNICSDIIKACDASSSYTKDVTFKQGTGGIYAFGAVVAKHRGDEQLCKYYVDRFQGISLPKEICDELMHGKAGYLMACLYLNQVIDEAAYPSSWIRTMACEILKDGRKMGNGRCPLMYEWNGEKYWGAAHGLAGICLVLMHTELDADQAEDVKITLKYMIEHRFISRNYPASVEDMDRGRDELVHWCHGAPGIAITLVKANQVFGDKEFLDAAMDAAEVTWKRGLLKRVGLCHGISGNAYVFLSLYRLTGKEKYLHRAKAFASFLLDRSANLIRTGEMHPGDRPYSLFEGIGGMAYLFLDMIHPTQARYPAYEL